MKYAIVSDLHANESAFRHVIDHALKRGVERIVCLGDVVGYGPLPAETVALARANCDVVLAGNHDDAVSGRGDASSFVDLAGDAVERHRAALGPDDLAWLRALPYTCELEGAIAAHGDFYDPPKFYYVEEVKDAEANFKATDAQIMFVGHTHVPRLFVTGRSGRVYGTDPQDFTAEPHKRYIVNPGSVGYPRESNGECYSSYVIYDSTDLSVTFKRIPFSVASVMQHGKPPRRVGKWLLAAVIAAAAALAALAAFLLTPRTVEVADDPALVVETKTVRVTPGVGNVRANLQLAKGSAPATLRVAFTAADGARSTHKVFPVKKSSAAAFPVPADAVEAEFTVLRGKPDAAPEILSFAPDVR